MAYREVIYVDRYSLLLSTKEGLKRLRCPFKVKCLVAVGSYGIGDILLVNEIREGGNRKLVYSIYNKEYDYYNFLIVFPQ